MLSRFKKAALLSGICVTWSSSDIEKSHMIFGNFFVLHFAAPASVLKAIASSACMDASTTAYSLHLQAAL